MLENMRIKGSTKVKKSENIINYMLHKWQHAMRGNVL